MTKRTMIAHHCRRSGRKRKCLSSSFNRRKAGGELFLTTLLSLCFPSKGKLPHQQNKQHSPLQAVPYCLGGDSTSLPRCSCFLGPQCGILRFLPSHVQTDLISWFKSDQEEAESCCVLLPGDSPVHALHVLKHCPASRICLGELSTPLEGFLCFFWKRYECILQNKTIPACTAVLHRLTPFCSYSEGFPPSGFKLASDFLAPGTPLSLDTAQAATAPQKPHDSCRACLPPHELCLQQAVSGRCQAAQLLSGRGHVCSGRHTAPVRWCSGGDGAAGTEHCSEPWEEPSPSALLLAVPVATETLLL